MSLVSFRRLAWSRLGRRGETARVWCTVIRVSRFRECDRDPLAWVSSGQRPPREEGLPAGGVRVRREVPSQEEARGCGCVGRLERTRARSCPLRS